MTEHPSHGLRNRLIGVAIGAMFGLALGAIIVGFIWFFQPGGVQNVWEALGIMVAGGAFAGLVRWRRSWPS